MYKKLWLVMSIALTLNGCGGGSDDSDDEDFGLPQPTEALTGIFLDSPVINADYTNAVGSHAGVTSSLGEYEYTPNETMVFSIGDLDLPSVNVGAVTTPLDMGHTLNTSHSNVTNIVRLLMTLDKDGDPANGITITDTAKSLATQVDFSLTEEEFAASGAVTNLIFNAGQDVVVSSLVSVADAVAHLEEQLTLNDIPFGTVDQQNDEAIKQYLSDNNLEATAGDSGMYYNIITEGTGDSPVSTSSVVVKYKGYLLDGTVFDQTSGDATASFSLTNLIVGWRLALPLLKPGGEGVFYFPSGIGYGANGSGATIPSNAVLVFEIELISFI